MTSLKIGALFLLAKKFLFLAWWWGFMAYMAFIMVLFTAMLPNTIIRMQVNSAIESSTAERSQEQQEIASLAAKNEELERHVQYEQGLHLEARMAAMEALMDLVVKVLYGIVAGVVGLVAAEGVRFLGIGVHRHRRITD